MTASATHRQYLRTLFYDAEEERKLIAFFQAVTKTTLPHLFTPQFPLPASLSLLTFVKWYEQSLKQDEIYNNANCQLST